MKRDNIFISEDYTKKRVAVVKFVAPGDVPDFECSIHFGEEGNDVTMQNCIIKENLIVKCSPEDTYDFEVGALIALMKMCGVEKVKQAVNETFFDVTRTVVNEYEEDIKKLKEENNYLNYIKSCNESAIESLENTRDLLINKNDELNEENKELKGNIDELFESEQHTKSELGRLYFEKHRLEEENEKLKLDCEKLQHGYNDMIFCGGRQNGKQYTALVELFKKIDQKKVDAAYKEAYNTTLPVWQKEVLKQAYNIITGEKEKRNGVQINKLTVDSLIEESRAFTRKCVNEWLYGPNTKRAEMWDDILACGDCEHSKYVEVKKEDLEAFAKECNEKKIFDISGYEFYIKEFWFADDRCIFQIFRKPSGFICAKSVGFAYEDSIVDYLPPMRWDLFKKGRLAVKVTYGNYKEFCEACEKELGKKPSTYFWDNVTISICKKDGNFEIFTIRHQKTTGRKIVNWEDVR